MKYARAIKFDYVKILAMLQSCFADLHNNIRGLRRNLETFLTNLLNEIDFNFSYY